MIDLNVKLVREPYKAVTLSMRDAIAKEFCRMEIEGIIIKLMHLRVFLI